MLFNSFEFAIFFAIVFLLYWSLPRPGQNILLLAASYIFYGLWSWKFLPLLFFCTLASYGTADRIAASSDAKTRRLWLICGLVLNLGVLVVFKYCNFFLENFYDFLALLGISVSKNFFNIILPIGLSFYTFQAMSYTFDVYRRVMKPAGTLLDYMTYLSFFPQLVAGPIGRAPALLPQFLLPRKFNTAQFKQGLYLIFWGLFQKIFVADNLARIVQPVFNSPGMYHGSDVLVALYAFAMQLYCDFAGYSNIARGLAATLGFNLMVNFNLPFWATNAQDFWNNWHISLSSWVRDYIYFPLMGALRKIKGNTRIYAAVVISFTLMGLWHGAAWHFVVFGLYYGILISLLIIIRIRFARFIAPKSPRGVALWYWLRLIFMFNLTASAMLFFHASSLAQVGEILSRIGASTSTQLPRWEAWGKLAGFSLPVFMMEYAELKTKDPFFVLNKMSWFPRIALLAFLTYLILGWGVMTAEEFIYFQF